MRDFGRRTADETRDEPAITLFKPLCGAEPQLYENLCTFCDQEYGDFEVIFGVAQANDPARAIAERVRDAFPSARISIAIGGEASAANPKVANLLNMAAAARGEIFVIADSDMRVRRNYLRSIVTPFRDARAGAVTCLYRGRPADGAASVLGAMYINSYFAPSVLVAAQLQGIAFGLGATIAVRRSALEAVGGFASLAAHLADDYELGRLIQRSAASVELSRYVVENVVAEPSVNALVQHELRWARTIAAVRPIGYAFSGVTFPLSWALIYLVLGGNPGRGFTLAAAALVSRVALQRIAHKALDSGECPALWMVPVREALAFGIWAASFFGHDVAWRDRRFEQDRQGRLLPKERAH